MRLSSAGRLQSVVPLSPTRFSQKSLAAHSKNSAHATVPFMLSPSAERLEEIASAVLDYAVRSACGLPTLAYKASGHWRAVNPHEAAAAELLQQEKQAAAQIRVRPSPSHQHRNLPVNAREDVLQVRKH